jgi:hypothetical protein
MVLPPPCTRVNEAHNVYRKLDSEDDENIWDRAKLEYHFCVNKALGYPRSYESRSLVLMCALFCVGLQ